MRRPILLLVPILAAATGCSQFMGPLQTRHLDRADAVGPDGRPYTIAQQEARGRERYTIPDNGFSAGPSTYTGIVDPAFASPGSSSGH